MLTNAGRACRYDMGRDRLLLWIHRLWNNGENTYDIAEKINITEAEVSRLLSEVREKFPRKEKLANHEMICRLCKKWLRYCVGPKICNDCRRKFHDVDF